MPVPPSTPRVLMLVAAAACWGVGTVITKQVLSDVAPLTLLPMQLSASCVFLLVMSLAGRTRATWSPRLRRLTALGLLNPGLANALGLLGLASISATMSVLLWATEPFVVLVIAAVLLRERVPVSLVALTAVALGGVLLVVHRPGAEGSGVGVALTLAAVAACALYTVLARRLLLDEASVSVALMQQVAALALTLVLLAATAAMNAGSGSADPLSLSPEAWLAAGGSGILYYGLAFWLYLTALRRVPASVAGAFVTLVPVFGIAAGYLVGERLADRQWVGAAVVVIAMGLIAVLQMRTEVPTRRRKGAQPPGGWRPHLP